MVEVAINSTTGHADPAWQEACLAQILSSRRGFA
jgi:hypothetical protein